MEYTCDILDIVWRLLTLLVKGDYFFKNKISFSYRNPIIIETDLIFSVIIRKH